jgi:hypothetical protein
MDVGTSQLGDWWIFMYNIYGQTVVFNELFIFRHIN